MIIQNRKRTPAIMSILGEDKEGEHKEEAPSDLHHTMKEFIEAVKADDVEGAVSAFKACSACADEGEPEE